ncbi:MAG: FkbM family methyltransferase [Lachnospiraceae bacterium]|nr:FkbM family methyltransferase [Lachnospiraceae bacterium]
MEKKKNFLDVLNLLEEVLTLVEAGFPNEGGLIGEQNSIWANLKLLVEEVNNGYFCSNKIIFNDLNVFLDKEYDGAFKDQIVTLLREWISFIYETDERRKSYKNYIDKEFYHYMDRARYVSYDVLREQVIDALYKNEVVDIGHMEYFYEHFSGFWGTLNIKSDNYEVIESRMHSITEHWQDFIWVYESLKDYRSKYVLLKDVEYWFTYKMEDTVLRMREYAFKDYFDLDLLHCNENEVIVDLGAYVGDSIKDFKETYGDYKKAFCFEVSPWNVEGIKQYLEGFHDINIIQKAAGDVCGKTTMFISPTVDSCNSKDIEIGFDTEVEVVTVDEEIKEPVTLIKMDIEGAEQSAIKGCKRHIIEDYPKLLICVYHNNEDIWKIPKMIYDIRDDYDFYLRSNGAQWGPSEIVFFALPKQEA